MSEKNTSQKERFLQEVEQKLLRRELDARLLEDGLIHVKWNEKPLCSVDRDGIVRFRPADITGPEVDKQLRTVIQTAGQVKEYMRIFERAPALKATGLEDSYKVLADFGDAVLAGRCCKTGANVKWGTRVRMQDGTYLPSSLPFGYRMIDKKIQIDSAQAEIVREIYTAYLAGENVDEIAERLNQIHAGSRRWYNTTIRYILSNERYIGDSLWQKTYATDTLPRKQIKNTGACLQYYVEGTHPAIIDKSTYEAVQLLRAERRKTDRALFTETSAAFRKKICCGVCGTPYQRKFIANDTYWICRLHNQSKEKCPNHAVPEKQIVSAFCRLYYKLKHHGGPIFTQMLSNLQKIRYNRMLWSEDVISLNKKISDILSQVQFLTQLQQAGGVDPDTFISSNNKLSEQLRRLKQEKARLLDTDSDDLADRTRDLMDVLEDGPDFLDSFDAELFDALVDKIIVDSNERLRFRLKNGLELTEQIERTKR